MGYHKENYKRIREEYDTKALMAERAADGRRLEAQERIPGLKELDSRLSSFGLQIMKAAMEGGNTGEAVARLREENKKILAERRALMEANGYPEDYCAPRYECDICRDSGYVGIKMCICFKRKLVEAGMESSGMSSLMKKQSFENFSVDYYRSNLKEYQLMNANLKAVKSYAEDFSLDSDSLPESLLFLGGTGLGKTHLSTAIARKVIERGYDVYYNSAVGMLSDFEQRRFGNGLISGEGSSDDTARYVECDLLILDDLGTEVVNQFTVSCLYHVINTRLNLQKPTIVSTNLSIADLRKIYNDRITSRLTGEFQMVPFYGTDVRRQKLQNH
jgi:DNA replication protein DnaC